MRNGGEEPALARGQSMHSRQAIRNKPQNVEEAVCLCQLKQTWKSKEWVTYLRK
jgi:hypothetical protein